MNTTIPTLIQSFITFDLFPLTSAICVALSCGLIGNHLVLRKQSLMGDAISHAVLPGLVVSFLLFSSRSSTVMFLGAGASALITVGLIELVKRLGRVEPGAAMGVVFSVMFALGVYLLEQASADHIDLDADCVLYGQLETLFFTSPDNWNQLFTKATLSQIPSEVASLIIMTLVVILFKALMHKELRIASFDPALASTQGIHPSLMTIILMVMTAACSVASFKAVGSILVIAMLICPAATARLLTDRLATQVILSAIIATTCAITGYALASWVPPYIGFPSSLNAAGMIAVVSGFAVALAAIGSPSHGIIAKARRQRALQHTVALEDLIGLLYRAHETGNPSSPINTLTPLIHAPIDQVISRALKQSLITKDTDALSLTNAGHKLGTTIIRRHRLWEGYLVDHAGLSPDHVHDTAQHLEHLHTSEPSPTSHTDPHGKPVPPPNLHTDQHADQHSNKN